MIILHDLIMILRRPKAPTLQVRCLFKSCRYSIISADPFLCLLNLRFMAVWENPGRSNTTRTVYGRQGRSGPYLLVIIIAYVAVRLRTIFVTKLPCGKSSWQWHRYSAPPVSQMRPSDYRAHRGSSLLSSPHQSRRCTNCWLSLASGRQCWFLFLSCCYYFQIERRGGSQYSLRTWCQSCLG